MAEHYYPDKENAPYGVARLGDKYSLLDVFEKFPKRERRTVSYFYTPIFMGVFSCTVMMVGIHALAFKSPMHKPWQTIAAGVLGGVVVYATLTIKEKREIRTEAICRDYIKTYPEHFPPIGMYLRLYCIMCVVVVDH